MKDHATYANQKSLPDILLPSLTNNTISYTCIIPSPFPSIISTHPPLSPSPSPLPPHHPMKAVILPPHTSPPSSAPPCPHPNSNNSNSNSTPN